MICYFENNRKKCLRAKDIYQKSQVVLDLLLWD